MSTYIRNGSQPDRLQVRLGCGHYVELHRGSSVFDFPDEPIWCEDCNTARQFDVTVQAMIYQLHDDE